MRVLVQQLNHIYMPKTPFETLALRDISLEVPDGSVTAVIGRTGSGKSTLVQHLNGLLKPTSGQAFVGGHRIHSKMKRKEISALRKHVGMVFQYPEHQLFEQTVEKDIMFGPLNLGYASTDIQPMLPGLLEKVGLDASFLPRSPFELSGGQMRRTAIAGVLAMEPSLLILDEPTAGLDPEGRQDMIHLFQDWQQKRGTTIIMITHQMEEAAALADHVIVMENGTIYMEGSPEEIYKREAELKELDLDLPEQAKVLKQIEAQTGITFSSLSLTPAEAVEEMSRYQPGREKDV
ncbi:energy-coupling factor transporter ATPase [Salibacterium halotolerans]|uniref:Energy-coupling factor transporter ATP-binding protein EcfA2 n=1 Tax=Salibacterium halotolerans TaxID=1884432 RepID=A0A1I5WGP0_9BACI|nr:energy-coupling factor transporter ATPase [Salibacterium halotolerans]SFQ18860.1 energy-coupling factor transport system ATP-binding protein [Salibacterium halotolerans]